MRLTLALLLAILIGLGTLAAGTADAGSRRGWPLLRILAYGDSLTSGCDFCAPITELGIEVLDFGRPAAETWARANCTSAPSWGGSSWTLDGDCRNVADRLPELSEGVCGWYTDAFDPEPTPTCLRQVYRPGDVVHIQIGTNDVRHAQWINGNAMATLLPAAWTAILAEIEHVGAPLVVTYPMPILESIPGDTDSAGFNERLRVYRDWMHETVLPAHRAAGNVVVEVDLYEQWWRHAFLHGEQALLDLYNDCGAINDPAGTGDCIHYQLPENCPGATGTCARRMAGQLILNAAIRANILHAARKNP